MGGLLAALQPGMSDRYDWCTARTSWAAAPVFMCEGGESANGALSTIKIADPDAKIQSSQ